ncbi:MAG: hypothetical protein CMM96_00710 [Rickettsiales bacterium]|nr:hypothetical protein [Rickettsiales bacterium]|tara:strand:- start:10716 stop:11756 length:1041 start_codon:yes stop_codon:yes gene_type:complete
MKNYIILGFGEWKGIWTNPQWMAHELANQNNNVLYINPPAYRDLKISDIARLFQRFKKSDKKNIRIKSHLGQKFFPKELNNQITKRIIRNFPKPYKVICFQPLWLDFMELDFERDVIFFTDDYTQVHKNENRITELNNFIKKKFKKVIVTHKNLLNDFPEAIVENNCIPSFINLQKLQKFRKKDQVCFIGTISDMKVDVKKLQSFILNNSNKKFVFCGPIKNNKFLSFVETQKNVEYKGLLSFENAFKISQESKYGLMPFRKNEYTDSMFSMKFFEYILANCIVLSTKIKMFDGLDKNFKINFIDLDETILGDLNYTKNDNSIRNKIINEYSYASRIKRLRLKGYL